MCGAFGRSSTGKNTCNGIENLSNIKFDNLYIDFDDTLKIEEDINADLMATIFRAKKKNKNVVLLTKNHDRTLAPFLHKYGIAHIFNNIIHLDSNEHKIDYMSENSLLVDDSFAERMAAIQAGNYAFNLDSVKLIDCYLDSIDIDNSN